VKRARLLGLWLAALALSAAAQRARDLPTARDALRAPHSENGVFFNPWERMDYSPWKALRWWLIDRNPFDKSREPRVPRVRNTGDYLARPAARPNVTWVGHATLAIQEGTDVVLTDPHFGPRALWPRRLYPPGVPLAAIPGGALAVVSHTHYDHLDEETVRALPESVTWFVPLGVGTFLRAWGRKNVVELDWWQSARHGDWTFTCLPSQHWSLRIGQARDATLWCAWLIDSGHNRYFFAGDTGWFPGFAEYGRRFKPIDVALLPIGAYEPRWFMRYQHMNPDEAYQAFLALGARYMIPMHWGTFDLSDEPLDLPPRALEEAVRARGGELRPVRILAIGERWELPARDPDEGRRALADRGGTSPCPE
jgi:L-ascorbate metabolism protein UlaG (beta-lactamase superfamily)